MTMNHLTDSQVKDSQELVSWVMKVIDEWFLEKKSSQLVLELRKALSSYDQEWEKDDFNPPITHAIV